MGLIRVLLLTNEEDPKQSDPYGPDNVGKENSKKSELEAVVELDLLEIQPVVTKKKKNKKIQERPKEVPPKE